MKPNTFRICVVDADSFALLRIACEKWWSKIVKVERDQENFDPGKRYITVSYTDNSYPYYIGKSVATAEVLEMLYKIP